MVIIDNLLNVKNDYVFKRIFGHIGNESITQNFLDSVLDEKVVNVKLDNNTILERDLLNDKLGIVDINAKINNEISCDIEMQFVNKSNIEQRILFYWSKLFIKNFGKGEDYSDLKKTIVIFIADFNLDSTEGIPKYITKWNLREEDFSELILTQELEFYIIELKKFRDFHKSSKKYKKLDSWIKFIESPGDIDMSSENNAAIKQAKEELEKISGDEHERYLADLRQKYIMDTKAAVDYGYKDGFKRGNNDRN